MSRPQAPFASRSAEYTSVASPLTFDPPIAWIQAIGTGNVVVKNEAGAAVTYASVAAYDVLLGPFSEITSTTSSKLRVGDGEPPESKLIGVEASAATSLDTEVSANLSAGSSATTSLTSRLSTVDSANLSTQTSAATSLGTRFSTADSTLTSTTTSITSRLSVAESVEASKG